MKSLLTVFYLLFVSIPFLSWTVQACDLNCASCNLNNCDACNSGYFLYNNVCYQDCPGGMWEDSLTGLCESCGPHCLDCLVPWSCNICESPYYYKAGACAQCPFYMYWSTTNNQCEYCEAHCFECSDANSCGACDTFLSNGHCVDECPPRSWYYYVGEGRVCEDCPNSSRCVACDQGVCTDCDGDYVLYNGDCIVGCQTVLNCVECNPADSNECVTCEDGYELQTDGTCSCPDGWHILDGDCVQWCPYNYYPEPSDNNCYPCTLGCGYCTDAVTCYYCETQYLLNNLCVDECPTGTTPDENWPRSCI